MTDKKELYRIVDFILNKADDGDLEVVKEALKKRLTAKSKGPGGIDINYLAHSMGSTISKQVSSSREYIRGTVTDYVTRIIKEHAPEITEEQLKVLLDEWVTPPPAGPPEEGQGKRASGKTGKLPPDVELKMIDQFLRFGSGKMPLEEQARLRESIPEWQEAYWSRFTPRIRGLLTLYLKGKIDSDSCWDEIQRELFDGQHENGRREDEKYDQ